jgi:hypothetical protein
MLGMGCAGATEVITAASTLSKRGLALSGVYRERIAKRPIRMHEGSFLFGFLAENSEKSTSNSHRTAEVTDGLLCRTSSMP